jgi:hypothetical protein
VWSSPKCLSTARGCSGCIEGSDLSGLGVAGGGSIDHDVVHKFAKAVFNN